MKEEFLKIPEALQKQLLRCFLDSGLGTIILVIIWVFTCDLSVITPCVLLTISCLGSSWVLWDRCIHQKYVVVEGVCTEIKRSHFCRHIQAIYIRNEDHDIKLVGAGMIKSLVVGDAVTAYVTDSTSVYDIDGHMVIYDHLAIVRGGRKNECGKDIRQTR